MQKFANTFLSSMKMHDILLKYYLLNWYPQIVVNLLGQSHGRKLQCFLKLIPHLPTLKKNLEPKQLVLPNPQQLSYSYTLF